MSHGNELRKDLEISLALGEMSQLMIVMLPSYLCLLCVHNPWAGQFGAQIPAEARDFSRFQDAQTGFGSPASY
jgi:hypothetical protein